MHPYHTPNEGNVFSRLCSLTNGIMGNGDMVIPSPDMMKLIQLGTPPPKPRAQDLCPLRYKLVQLGPHHTWTLDPSRHVQTRSLCSPDYHEVGGYSSTEMASCFQNVSRQALFPRNEILPEIPTEIILLGNKISG